MIHPFSNARQDQFVSQTLGLALLLQLLASEPNAAGALVCDEASLRQAISQGGSITLCGGMLRLSEPLVIDKSVDLQGAPGPTGLDGGGRVRLFHVVSGGSLSLGKLILTGGYVKGHAGSRASASGEGVGGAILNEGGRVELSGCFLRNNRAEGGDGVDNLTNTGFFTTIPGGPGRGGAIFSRDGQLRISQCSFEQNVAEGGAESDPTILSLQYTPTQGGDASGGAIACDRSDVEVQQSSFVNNQSIGGRESYDSAGHGGHGGWSQGGAISLDAGSSQIQRCGFVGNTVSNGAPAWGGGLSLSGGTLLITGTSFGTNSALGARGYRGRPGYVGQGGAIHSAGSLRMVGSRLEGNKAIGSDVVDGSGGGLFNAGGALIERCLVERNTCTGGKPFFNPQAGISVGISGRGLGAGVYNSNQLILIASTLIGNVAVGGEAGIYTGPNGGGGADALGGGLYNRGECSAENTTFVNNSATGSSDDQFQRLGRGIGGGVVNQGGMLTLRHVTLAGNEARGGQGGSGTNGLNFGGAVFASTNGTLVMANTLIGASTADQNVSGVVVDQGGNLCSDSSALFTTSLNNTDPKLGPLGNYGGGLPTLPLLPGSPAIDAGWVLACPPLDQRGWARPFGRSCDIGAFESHGEFQSGALLRDPSDPGIRLLYFDQPGGGQAWQTSTDLKAWNTVAPVTVPSVGWIELLTGIDSSELLRFYRVTHLP